MNLSTLEAVFMRIKVPGQLYDRVDDLSQAQGIRFLCPLCFAANNGPVGTHSVLCWFRGRGVPDTEEPLPGRWEVSGTGLSDLTLSPSVLITTGCRWHGWVRNGDAGDHPAA